jgi:hypothetical protein
MAADKRTGYRTKRASRRTGAPFFIRGLEKRMLDSPPLGGVAQVQNLLRLFNDAGRACVVDKEVQNKAKDASMIKAMDKMERSDQSSVGLDTVAAASGGTPFRRAPYSIFAVISVDIVTTHRCNARTNWTPNTRTR